MKKAVADAAAFLSNKATVIAEEIRIGVVFFYVCFLMKEGISQIVKTNV